MERCRFSPQRLSLYLDGQYPGKKKAAIERHLSKCIHCQKEIILLQTARLALKSFAKVKLPDTLDREFVARLYQENSKK